MTQNLKFAGLKYISLVKNMFPMLNQKPITLPKIPHPTSPIPIRPHWSIRSNRKKKLRDLGVSRSREMGHHSDRTGRVHEWHTRACVRPIVRGEQGSCGLMNVTSASGDVTPSRGRRRRKLYWPAGAGRRLTGLAIRNLKFSFSGGLVSWRSFQVVDFF